MSDTALPDRCDVTDQAVPTAAVSDTGCVTRRTLHAVPTVRVVQISDTHLGATRAGAVDPEDGLAATLRSLAGSRPDLVLLTGDLTDGGQADEYRRIREMVEPLGAPMLAVAGNHDDPAALRSHFGGESERFLDAWRIVTVETFVAGEIHGAIDLPALLRRLGPDTGRPTLLAMHHPPISTSDKDWFELIGGAGLVAALAERTDVRLVLGGHLHDVYRVSCGGVTYAGCPSTWYSLEHVGDLYRHDDGEVGALKVDLFADGRFELEVVSRDRRTADRADASATRSRRSAERDTRLFDRYVMLRWSTADKPTRGDDSVWRVALDTATGEVDVVNHATRSDAVAALTQELLAVADDERIFLGVDFPLGYPAGFAERFARGGANWRAAWAAITDEVVDSPTNENNRFVAADRLNDRAGMSPGPFWGCPPGEAVGSLGADRPPTLFGLAEHRIVERRLAGAGIAMPTVWQLAGPGAVGGAALLGIPVLRRLSEHPTLARRVRIWPFDTGCDLIPTRGSTGAIVVAQVWPAAFARDEGTHALPEIAQLAGVCRQLAALDATGRLGERFAPALSVDEYKVVEREEGWVVTP